MKLNQSIKSLAPLYSLCCLLFLTACRGEDRRLDYTDRIEPNQWMEETMREIYLWYQDIPEESKLNYFAEPIDFFYTLLSTKAESGKGDPFSVIIENSAISKSLPRESTYGFDYILYTPNAGSKISYAHIIFVAKNAPASEAGIKRGDWIAEINGQPVTTNNYGYLTTGNAVQFTLAQLVKDGLNYSWINGEVKQVAAARAIEDNPFYIDTLYTINNKNIAYLMYNRFSTGPNDTPDEETYNNEMRRIFNRFKSGGINEFILDLRYNPGGYLTCSQLLATLLAPESSLEKIYCKVEYNDKNKEKDTALFLSSKLIGNGANLNLKKLYVIVTSQTASASEAVINCLMPYMGEENIILIGTRTVGKNVASIEITNPKYPQWTLQPIVAKVLNSQNTANYSHGFTPNVELNESLLEFAPLYNLGDTSELLLNKAIQLITAVDVPAEEEKEASKVGSILPAYHSMERKNTGGIKLR